MVRALPSEPPGCPEMLYSLLRSGGYQSVNPEEAHLGVLVGGDGHEGSLGEGESLEDAPANAEHVVRLDDVEARVVAVHGVEDDLESGERVSRVLLVGKGFDLHNDECHMQ